MERERRVTIIDVDTMGYLSVRVEGAGSSHIWKNTLFGNPRKVEKIQAEVQREIISLNANADRREGRQQKVRDMIQRLSR